MVPVYTRAISLKGLFIEQLAVAVSAYTLPPYNILKLIRTTTVRLAMCWSVSGAEGDLDYRPGFMQSVSR